MIFIAAILALIFVIVFYRRTLPEISTKQRYFLTFLRYLAIFTVLLLLLNPVLYFLTKSISKPVIFFLNDTSESMEQTDNEITKTSALNHIKEKIKVKADEAGYNIEEINFANGLEGETGSTYLSKSLQQLKEESKSQTIEQVVLLSDGWFHDQDLSIIENLDFPVSIVNTDFSDLNVDLIIENVKINKTGYINEITPLIVTVVSANYSDSATVDLLINDRLIESKTVNFAATKSVTVVFEPLFDKTGINKADIRIKADLDETNTKNNSFPVAINIIDKQRKILVISDILNWDVKFMIDAINSQEGWEATYLNKRNTLQYKDQRVRLDDFLNKENVVILINSGSLSFSNDETEILRNYLIQGGGLMVMGQLPTSLISFAPATKTSIDKTFKASLVLSEISRKYETFNWENINPESDIPPVSYFYVNPKLQAEVLAYFNNEDNSAAIIYENYEKGRFLYCSFLELWKWQLWQEGNYYTSFIQDIMQWLGQQETDRYIAFTDKSGYFEGEDITVKLQVFDEKMLPLKNLTNKLTVYSDSKEIFSDFLIESENIYSYSLSDLEAGDYHFEISENFKKLKTKGSFIIADQNAESRDRGFNHSLLHFIATRTKGNIYSEKSNFKFEKVRQINNEKKHELPLYRKWYILVIFLLSFCTELYLRIRWGLL